MTENTENTENEALGSVETSVTTAGDEAVHNRVVELFAAVCAAPDDAELAAAADRALAELDGLLARGRQ